MNTLSSRIKLVRKHLDINQQELSDMLNIKHDRVKSLEAGRIKEMTSQEVYTMVNKLHFSLDWLVAGKGDMLIENHIIRNNTLSNNSLNNYALVPKYDIQASAGNGSIIHSELIVDHLAFSKSWLSDRTLNINKLCLIETKGDSMEPTLFNRDLLLVDMQQTELRNGIYVIQLNDYLLVKRIQRKLDGTIIIKSDNMLYETEELTPKSERNLQVIGEVVWYGRAMA